ncbi:MAG TPA: FeoA family protein [Marmoricola sp.]|jgi:ferrous iron transport protein A
MRDQQAPPGGLGTASIGSTVQVTGIRLSDAHRLRLAQLGVRVGARVRVLGRTSGGGRVLGIGSARLAVDRATAGRVEVAAA